MIPRNDLVQIVSEDLQYLKEEWNESVEDSALKRGNTVLRRLLVQNELQRAWRAVGLPSQPLIRASALKPILDEIPREKIVLAGAGGARYKGIELRGILIAHYAMNKTEIKSQHEAGVPSAKMKLCDFIDAPCGVVSGELVPRRMLINYIATSWAALTSIPSARRMSVFSHCWMRPAPNSSLPKNQLYISNCSR